MQAVVLEAPLFLVLPENPEKKFYLTLNNYIKWSPGLRTKLRRMYCEGIKKQMLNQSVRVPAERVTCSVLVFPPNDKRVRDVDNHTFVHVKWSNDALTEIGLWADDSIVCPIHLDRGPQDKEHPRVQLSYTETTYCS